MAGPGMAHGGMRAAAARRFPEAPRPFIDLSTGINPLPYPMPGLPPDCLHRLPDPEDLARLEAVAARAYQATDPAMVVAAPGTQILISLLPHLLPRPAIGEVAILSPTYGEHACAWADAGYRVREIADLAAAAGAGHIVLCNPNNPDGRRFPAHELRAIADRLKPGAKLVADEAFADFEPAGISLVPTLPHPAIVALRSFGKSYGLAGIRLGFLIAAQGTAALIRRALGPWAVSGPAISAGPAALDDPAWRQAATERLRRDAIRLDGLLASRGCRVVGGTRLFRLVQSADAARLHAHLGHHGILVRAFAGQPDRLRFGLPGDPCHWARLERALADFA